MSVTVAPGMVVEAITKRGLAPVIVDTVSNDDFTGYILSPRAEGVVLGTCTALKDEIISVTSDRAIVIRTADDETVGALVMKTEDGLYIYHLDNGERIGPSKTLEGVLKIISRTFHRYANDAVLEERDWSATAKQADDLVGQQKTNVRLLAYHLGED